MNKKIVLGNLGKAWGVKGQIKFYPANPISNQIENTRWVFVSSGVLFYELQVKSAQKMPQCYLLSFEKITTPEQVSAYVGKDLFVSVSQIPQLKENEFYAYALEGLQVYDDENFLGVVKQLENYGAGDLLYIDAAHPSIQKSFYLPLREEFVESIELSQKKIKIKNWKDFV